MSALFTATKKKTILSFAPLLWSLFGILCLIFLGKNYIVLAGSGSALSGYECYHSTSAAVDSLLDQMAGITIAMAVLLIIGGVIAFIFRNQKKAVAFGLLILSGAALIISTITLVSIPIGAARLERDISIGIGAILNLVVSGIMAVLSVVQFLYARATTLFADHPRMPLLWILFGGSFFLFFCLEYAVLSQPLGADMFDSILLSRPHSAFEYDSDVINRLGGAGRHILPFLVATTIMGIVLPICGLLGFLLKNHKKQTATTLLTMSVFSLLLSIGTCWSFKYAQSIIQQRYSWVGDITITLGIGALLNLFVCVVMVCLAIVYFRRVYGYDRRSKARDYLMEVPLETKSYKRVMIPAILTILTLLLTCVSFTIGGGLFFTDKESMHIASEGLVLNFFGIETMLVWCISLAYLIGLLFKKNWTSLRWISVFASLVHVVLYCIVMVWYTNAYEGLSEVVREGGYTYRVEYWFNAAKYIVPILPFFFVISALFLALEKWIKAKWYRIVCTIFVTLWSAILLLICCFGLGDMSFESVEYIWQSLINSVPCLYYPLLSLVFLMTRPAIAAKSKRAKHATLPPDVQEIQEMPD